MIVQFEVLRNGPYLRILLPDCGSDWPRLDREVDDALDEGVTFAQIVAPAPIGTGDLKRVVALTQPTRSRRRGHNGRMAAITCAHWRIGWMKPSGRLPLR